MSITPEELAAYADGELDAAAAHQVEAEISADPRLQAQLAAHRALRERLAAHFAPIAEQAVPERLSRALSGYADRSEVVDISTAAHPRRGGRSAPRWVWLAGPALAAVLVLAVLGPWSSTSYAEGDLADALETQLVATQSRDAPVRILLSFRNEKGKFCRGFSQPPKAGIACREDGGWSIRTVLHGSSPQRGEYRQAGSADAEVLTIIQDMAEGPGLDGAEERMAARNHWLRPQK